ncbi:MAG: ComEC/Rec2 family competence protein [Planctomycetota bacterium]
MPETTASTPNPSRRLHLPSAVWCAAVHVLTSGMMLHSGPPALWLADVGSWLAIGCCALALLQRIFLYPALPLLLLASIGLALQRAPRPQTLVVLEPRPVRLTARLREWHVQEDQSWALFDQLQDVAGLSLAPGNQVLLGLAATTPYQPTAGQRLSLEGRLAHDGRSFRLEAFRWHVQQDGRAPPLMRLRQAVRARFHQALSPAEAGLAIALLLGERRELTPMLQETYRRFGLVHLLAVSGMHFWLWDQLLRRLLRGPFAYARLPILCGAAILAGASAPVMRALWVVVLRDVAARFTRPVRGLHLWAAAWSLELCFLPPSTLGLGFILSYAATGFLILGAAPAGKPKWVKALQASWVAFLGSMPFLHMVQGTLEPWSIPLSPLMGLLLPLRLSGALLALIPGCGSVVDWFLRSVSWVESCAFKLLEHAPWSPWLTPQDSSFWYLLAAVIGLLAVHPKLPSRFHLRKILWSLLLLCLIAPTPHRAGISILPVGHGLGVVIAGTSRSLSFDLGSGERAPRDLVERILFPELLLRHWPVPDRMIQSHSDRDHVNGYPYLQQRLDLENIVVEAGKQRIIPDLEPWSVTAYACQGAKLGVSNDAGHILDLRLNDFRAVLLGDQSGASLHDLCRRLPPGPIDLLLIPHHGLTTDGLAQLLLHLQPKRAWSSSGTKNFPLPVAPLLQHFGVPLETTLHGALRWPFVAEEEGSVGG